MCMIHMGEQPGIRKQEYSIVRYSTVQYGTDRLRSHSLTRGPDHNPTGDGSTPVPAAPDHNTTPSTSLNLRRQPHGCQASIPRRYRLQTVNVPE